MKKWLINNFKKKLKTKTNTPLLSNITKDLFTNNKTA